MNFPLPLGQALRRKKAERVALLPVSIREGKVYPLDYHGSAHIHAYLDADAIGYIPIGIHTLEEGDPIHVRLL